MRSLFNQFKYPKIQLFKPKRLTKYRTGKVFAIKSPFTTETIKLPDKPLTDHCSDGYKAKHQFIAELSTEPVRSMFKDSLSQCIEQSKYKVDLYCMEWIYNCIKNNYDYTSVDVDGDGHSGMSWSWTVKQSKEVMVEGEKLILLHKGLDYVNEIKKDQDVYLKLVINYGLRKWVLTENAMGYDHFLSRFFK